MYQIVIAREGEVYGVIELDGMDLRDGADGKEELADRVVMEMGSRAVEECAAQRRPS